MSENAATQPSPSPPSDPLSGHAATQPNKLAVIDDRPDGTYTAWTFAELNRRANRLANSLLRAGVGARERVVWCGMNSPDVVVMGHAARKAGITAVPLNYRLAADEAAYVIENSDAGLAWIDADLVGLFEEVQRRVPGLRRIAVYGGAPGAGGPGRGMESAEDFQAGAPETDPPPPTLESRTMIYTSGTTGKPKGAVRTGQGNPDQLRAMVGHIGYRPDDIYITTGPLYHSGPGGFMSIAHLLSNTVVLQRKFDPEDWLRLVAKHRATSTFSAPTPIRSICRLPKEVKARHDHSSLRIMIANAAPWPFALKQAYLENFAADSLWEVYGSTELGVNLILRPQDQLRKPGSCGEPAPGVQVRLFDDQGGEVTTARTPGELFVRSASIFDTYHKARDKYEADTREDFHTVGDVAFFDEEGYYFICDRKKDMIISGGVNIYPAEVEAALEEHPLIVEAAVFGIPSEEWGESVHAAVVAQAGAELAADQVIAFSREKLASYKIPRSVSFLDDLPKTGSGKILKRSLREPYWKDHSSQVV